MERESGQIMICDKCEETTFSSWLDNEVIDGNAEYAEYIEWLEKYGGTVINRTLIKAIIIINSFMNFIDKLPKV